MPLGDGDKGLKAAQKQVKSIKKRGAEVNNELQQTAAKIQILGNPATRAAADALMKQTQKHEPAADSYRDAFRDAARKELRLWRPFRG